MSARPAEHRLYGVVWAAVTVVLVAVLTGSALFTPEAIERGLVTLWPACPYRALLHRDCPTCGMTRAFAALGHGRVEDARRYNRGAPYAAVLVLVLIGVGTSKSRMAFRRASGASR